MEFKVELEGLDILSQKWNGKRISKQFAQNIAAVSSTLTQNIRTSVVRRYSIKGEEVDKVLLNKSASAQKRGKNNLKTGVIYRYKAIPLNKFSYETFTVNVNSRFLIPRGKSFVMIKKRTAEGVKVSVVRGTSKVVTGNYGFGGFLQKRGTSKWAEIQGGKVKSFPTGIYERKQNATWVAGNEPTVRTPIRRAYGPSVTQMIEHQLDNDNKLKAFINNFDSLLAANIDL